MALSRAFRLASRTTRFSRFVAGDFRRDALQCLFRVFSILREDQASDVPALARMAWAELLIPLGFARSAWLL